MSAASLHYDQRALGDLEQIIAYGIEQGHTDPEGYARQLMQRIAGLQDHPKQGRAGRMAGTRELVLSGTPFIVVYTVQGAAVRVRRVLHGAIQWPSDP